MVAHNTIDSSEVEKFARLAHKWWDENGPLKTLHDINPPRIDFISQYVDFTTSSILDVGCGAGILSEAMAKKGAKVIGLDLDNDLIDVAKQHAKDLDINIDYVCEPLETFEHEQFDVITSLEMLEHVNNPEKVIEHCNRLLKPGGLLFLSTINRTLKSYLLVILAAEHLLNIIPKNTHEYNKFIKPAEISAILRKNKFRLLNIKGLDYNPITRVANLSDNVDMNFILVAQKYTD